MSGPKTESPATSVKVILVVEDDEALRTLIVRTLSTRFKVEQAVDGQAALELLGRIAPPSLILLDVMMPRMDGLTVARKLKTDPKLKVVPIVFLTAKGAAADVVAGIGAGAKQYLTKPFAVTDLLQKVEKFAR